MKKKIYCEDCDGLGWDDLSECLFMDDTVVYTNNDGDDLIYHRDQGGVKEAIICTYCDGEGVEQDFELLEDRWIEQAIDSYMNYRGFTYHYVYPPEDKPYIQALFQWGFKRWDLFKLPMWKKNLLSKED